MPDIWLLIAILPVAVLVVLFMARLIRPKPNVPDSAYESRPSKSRPPKSNEAAPTTVHSPRQPIEEAEYLDKESDNIGGDFYSEVAALLLQVLNENPSRQDLRLKLLEVYFDSGQKDEFVRHAQAYRSNMEKGAHPDWNKIVDMGRSLAPKHELFGGVGTQIPDAPSGKTSTEVQIRRFGDTPEARPVLEKLALEYRQLRNSSQFLARLDLELIRTAARPGQLMYASRLSRDIGGARIYVKREDINTSLPRLRIHLMGQAWIAKCLGKTRLHYAAIDGDEAVIAAQAAARVGLECGIQIVAQQSRVRDAHRFQVEMMGGQLTELSAEQATADIRQHALKTWLAKPEDSFLMLNLAAGPHPYPTIASDLQSVIGRETLRQVRGQVDRPPKAVFARGGNTADAIGFVEPFLAQKDTEICLVTSSDGDSLYEDDASQLGDIYKLLFTSQQKQSAHHILEEMEFPRVTREHAMLKATGRVQYLQSSSEDAQHWAKQMAVDEGVIFPLESAAVLASACRYARQLSSEDALVIMLAENLDKDLMGLSIDSA